MNQRRSFQNGFTITEMLIASAVFVIGALITAEMVQTMQLSLRNIQSTQAVADDQNRLLNELKSPSFCRAALSGVLYQGTTIDFHQDVVAGSELLFSNPDTLKKRSDGLVISKAQLVAQPLATPTSNFYAAKLTLTYLMPFMWSTKSFESPGVPLLITTNPANLIVDCKLMPVDFGGNFEIYYQCYDGKFPPSGCPTSYFTLPTQTACRHANSVTGGCFCPPGFTVSTYSGWVGEGCWEGGKKMPLYSDNSAPWPPKPMTGPGSAAGGGSSPQNCGVLEFQCILE